MVREDDVEEVCEAQETNTEENMEHMHNNIADKEAAGYRNFIMDDERKDWFNLYNARRRTQSTAAFQTIASAVRENGRAPVPKVVRLLYDLPVDISKFLDDCVAVQRDLPSKRDLFSMKG